MRTRTDPRFRRGLAQRRPLPTPPHRRRGTSITPQRLREVSARPRFRPRRRGYGGLLTLGIVLGLLLVVAATSLGLQQAYAGKIYPRVNVNGYAIGGKTPPQARALLHAIEGAEIHMPFVLRGSGHTWTITPAQFGAHYNVNAAVRAAYAIGRRGSWLEHLRDQFAAVFQGVSVPMQGAHDNERLATYVATLAPAVFVAPRPAIVGPAGEKVAILHEPVAGQQLDTAQALTGISAALDAHELAPIDLPTVTVASAINHDVAQAAVDSTRSLLRGPVTLTYPNAPNPWILNPQALARLLTFTPVPDRGTRMWTLRVGIDLPKLSRALRGVASTIYKPPHDATYVVAGTYVTVLPDLTGYALNLQATADALLALQNTAAPSRTINLPTKPVTAPFTTARAQALAFNALMSQTSASWSSVAQGAEQVVARDTAHDVAVAAGLLDNVRLEPGAVLTYTAAVGPINATHDYFPGLNRLGPADVSGIAGGATQVAGALYQAAYTAGLGIVRRVPLPYLSAMGGDLGFDAAAYATPSGPDLIVKNTTSHQVLIKTVVDPGSTTVKVYLYNTAAAVPPVSIGKASVVTHPDARVDVSYGRQVGGTSPVAGNTASARYAPLEAP